MVSILIPLYNGIEFLDETINSVLSQTYPYWEIIIGVNGHPENSDIFKNAKCYENNKIRVFDFYYIKGKSNTLNEMLKYCNYDYVALLDADDVWHPYKLQIQSKYLNKYDVIGTKCVYFGDINGIVPDIPVNDISNFDFYILNPIINSSSIIRKELCSWDSNYDGVEDYDLWLRLRKLNKQFFNCDNVVVKHRIHNNSAFNAKGNNNKVPELIRFHIDG